MTSRRPSAHDIIDQIDDPFVRRLSLAAVHFRRYLPFYILGLVWAMSLALFPSIQKQEGGGTQVASSSDLNISDSNSLTSGDSAAATDDAQVTTDQGASPSDLSDVKVQRGSSAVRGSVAKSSASAQQSAAAAKVMSGTSRSGT